jgi:hypothetical protein
VGTREPEIETGGKEKDSASMLEKTRTGLSVENIRRRIAGSEPFPQNDGCDDSDDSSDHDCSLNPARFSRIPQILSREQFSGSRN